MNFLKKLEGILDKRKKELPDGSYSARLFIEGEDRILRKITEEAGEVIIAAKNNDKKELKNELADLIFHILVLLKKKELSIDAVIKVLEKRHEELG